MIFNSFCGVLVVIYLCTVAAQISVMYYEMKKLMADSK